MDIYHVFFHIGQCRYLVIHCIYRGYDRTWFSRCQTPKNLHAPSGYGIAVDICTEEQNILCRIHIYIPSVELHIAVQLLRTPVVICQYQAHRCVITEALHHEYSVRALARRTCHIDKSISGCKPLLQLCIYIQFFKWLTKYTYHSPSLSIKLIHSCNCAIRQYGLHRIAGITAALSYIRQIFLSM